MTTTYKAVSTECLEKLRLLVRMKDEAAHGLGVAILSSMEERARILSKMKNGRDKKSLLRLGALEYEASQHKTFFFDKIQSFSRDQKQVGEEGMREVGVDPDSGEFTLDPANGVIMQLVEGEYVPLEIAAGV